MGKGNKINPARRKSMTNQMADYQRNLRQRPVSATKEAQSLLDTDSTDYTPPSNIPPPREVAASPKLHITNLWIGIAAGLVSLLLTFGGLFYKFGSLSNTVDTLEKNIRESKKELYERINKSEEELRRDIRQVNDRIDKYYQKR